MLTQDKKFIASHLEPEPFVLENPMGKPISYKTADGKEGYGYEIKNNKSTNKYVLVIHEWWGLNDYVKKESEKIFNALGDVNVIAVDLYDGKVALTRDSAAKYMGEVKTERAETIIKGVLAYAGNKAEIATIGWCFGGGWSMQAALLAGGQCKACVMYYGMPEEKPQKLKALNAPVLFVFAQQDKWINKDVVAKFEKRMTEEKKQFEIKSYDADHAFANPSNPKYNRTDAEDAFKHSMDFMRKNVK